MKILLENLLRCEDGVSVTKASIQAVAQWDAGKEPDTEIAFMPARVVLQDFTGVPCVVDLAAMRDAVVKLGGSASNINPLIPSELVIDHSVQVDSFGKPARWMKTAKSNSHATANVTASCAGAKKPSIISKWCRQTPASCTRSILKTWRAWSWNATLTACCYAFPDTVFGTDSHTTMINGIGVLGWGVGGIEAEAAMLGQPSSMLIPQVVGFKLTGKLPEGATATDLVLTVTQMLRSLGVVGKFVEFFGDGLNHLPLGRPCHHRQHGAGVRRDLRHLPDRQRSR